MPASNGNWYISTVSSASSGHYNIAIDEDFQELMRLLKMHIIPPDEVRLMPALFIEK